MGFTPEQIKGRIKSVAKQNNADARTLMRIYMILNLAKSTASSSRTYPDLAVTTSRWESIWNRFSR